IALAIGPGQPFDDDDPGCVPDTSDHRKCSETLAKAFAKLIAAVTSCHDRQTRAAFAGSSFDEEACEIDARARFEAIRDAVAPRCSATQLALASDEETELLDPTKPCPDPIEPCSLDAQNGGVYCDSTSGNALDSGGDDSGWVPATVDVRWCARGVAKNLAKLAQAAVRCHAKMAYTFLAGRTFDEEACEEFDPLTGRGARDRYSMRALRLIAHGGCPSCLDDIQQEALAVRSIGQMDDDNARQYPCT